jgi:hypothetical protein
MAKLENLNAEGDNTMGHRKKGGETFEERRDKAILRNKARGEEKEKLVKMSKLQPDELPPGFDEKDVAAHFKIMILKDKRIGVMGTFDIPGYEVMRAFSVALGQIANHQEAKASALIQQAQKDYGQVGAGVKLGLLPGGQG